MRTILCGLWVLGGIGAAASIVSGCSSTCSDTGSCGTYTAPNGGGGAVSTGNAGTSGAGHAGAGGAHGGASGTSGDSGTSGESGASGTNSAGDSGEAGTAGGGGMPCDSTKSPSVAACVVSDGYAIFVAPTGKDTAAGSQAAPVQSIAKAVLLAGDSKIVIACDGTYDEQVKLTGGVKLYGGFACPDSASPWTYEAGKKAKVAPSARGLALSIAAGASSVMIEDFEFDAKDGMDPGESSVAAFVNTSSSVALTRVKLVAGKGVDGANGSLSQVTFPLPAALKGNAATGDTGGLFNSVTCPAGGSTKGGQGGSGGGAVTGGGPGAPTLGGGAAGIVGAVCAGPGGGGDGSSASPQPPAPGATKLGTITPAGWSGVSGSDGTPGTPGQGGGGGTGAATGGGGGGGGAGGCGGAGATGGKAGGSSISLLLLNSTVTFTANELVAANAGKGGNGITGQGGQTVAGNGGFPDVSGGCGGGKGGLGGNGGSGGGAAGGISVGIAYVGLTAPAPDSATTLTTGAAGAKGIGGVPGTNDGLAGVKQDVLQVL